MEGADPKQRLALPAAVTKLVLQRRRPFEQRKLPGVFLLTGQESCVQDPAAGQRQASLRGVQNQICSRQRAVIAVENSPLVEQSRLFEWICLVGHRGAHRLPSASN